MLTNNGERHIKLCQTFQLVIGGSIFPRKENTTTPPQMGKLATRLATFVLMGSGEDRYSMSDIGYHELITDNVKVKLGCNTNLDIHGGHKRFNIVARHQH